MGKKFIKASFHLTKQKKCMMYLNEVRPHKGGRCFRKRANKKLPISCVNVLLCGMVLYTIIGVIGLGAGTDIIISFNTLL